MHNRTVFSGVQINRLTVLAGLFCLAIAAGASAAERNKPCADDAAKLCEGVQRGEGRVAQCLKEHESELSSACKKNIAKLRAAGKNLKQACEGDKDKLCKDTQPGGGKILQCLKQHEGELSAACKKQMAQLKDKKQ